MKFSKEYDISDGIIAIDVGSGTQDILVWNPEIPMENCPKMVLPSSTAIIARQIEKATSMGYPVFLSGTTMGGGPCSSAIRKHLKAGLKVFATEAPALTFHDDIEKVKKMGIRIVDTKPEIKPLIELQMRDIFLDRLRSALGLFQVNLPDFIAVAVQDHGYSPKESNREFRFRLWRTMIESNSGEIAGLIHENPPAYLTRMKAVCETAPGAWVMDTGASAIMGSLSDSWVAEKAEEGVIILNAGNEHTVAALIKDEKVWGIYEHHTSLLDSGKLKDHLSRFRTGALSHSEVFDEMGHGCFTLPAVNEVSAFKHLSLTGPNRERFRDLGGHMAAPFGDMMLTGCFGLVEAVKRKIDSYGG